MHWRKRQKNDKIDVLIRQIILAKSFLPVSCYYGLERFIKLKVLRINFKVPADFKVSQCP